MKYMPQLDGIRAIAIFSVLIAHFLPTSVKLTQVMHFGRLGVLLFFVLSGFLITRILVLEREAYLSGRATRRSLLATFYMRRSLRIFPIYYLVILVFSILGYAPVLDHWGWHVTYTSNFSQAFIEGDYGHSRHLWSLCVEEQFYLFWPFIVIFTPRRHLPRVIVCLILGAVLYRFGGSLAGLDWKQATRPLLGCVDSLGFGALLAVYWCDPDKYAKQSALLLRLSLWLGLPLLVGTQTLYALSPSPRGLTVYVALVDLSSSLFFVYLLHNAAMNKQHLFGRLLALSPVRYVGKISYGIYLYHFFLIDVLWSLSTRLNVQIPTGWPYFLVHVAATILVAAVSWHVIEKPINNLKNRIPY